MNQLSTKQRKYLYFGGILILLILIIFLGMPSGSGIQTADNSEQQASWLDLGGKLAQLRTSYSLGESNLGKVDPSSSTMNLVLLGLRGFAVNKLWMDAIYHQGNKNWAQLDTNVNSIILLQPHYVSVWRYQGWNLAWNVSREWDAIEDRYYWVKKGGKFLIKGQKRNYGIPEFYSSIGRILGEKIGVADEWVYYRKYFFVDPNLEKFDGSYDPEFNVSGLKDNYLAAKAWYLEGNDVEKKRRSRLLRIVFRQKPALAQKQSSMTLLKEGKLDANTLRSWEITNDNWTKIYHENDQPGLGMERFNSLAGIVYLEASSQKELNDLQKEDAKPGRYSNAEKQEQIDRLQSMINYRYWRARSKLEQNSRMLEIRKEIAQGKAFFADSEYTNASKKLMDGMSHLNRFMQQGEEGAELSKDPDMIDEILMAVFIWRQCLKKLDNPIPQQYPLKSIWDLNQDSLLDITLEFKRKYKLLIQK